MLRLSGLLWGCGVARTIWPKPLDSVLSNLEMIEAGLYFGEAGLSSAIGVLN